MKDAIIEEVRATREGLVAEKGGLAGLLQYLKIQEARHPEKSFTPAQRRAEQVADEGRAGSE